VYFEDRYLGGFYDVPISTSQVVDYFPRPDSIARRVEAGELMLGGRGVYAQSLPGQSKLSGRATAALFRRVAGFDPRMSAGTGAAAESRAAGRVEAYLAVLAGDSAAWLSGEAVVFEDSTFREVARQRSRIWSWCGSDSVRVLQFNFDLPPGRYVVGMSARDSSTRASGAWRAKAEVPPPQPGNIELSDLELACGFEAGPSHTPFTKTDYAVVPNPMARVPRDDPFGFYFEIYNLVTGADSRAQVATEYTIRSTKKDRRPFFVKWVASKRNDAAIVVSRTDDVPGRARFQYVSANLAGQAPGPYRIEVEVSDPATGRKATRSLDFELVE
jgi:hypothetical protein